MKGSANKGGQEALILTIETDQRNHQFTRIHNSFSYHRADNVKNLHRA